MSVGEVIDLRRRKTLEIRSRRENKRIEGEEEEEEVEEKEGKQ